MSGLSTRLQSALLMIRRTGRTPFTSAGSSTSNLLQGCLECWLESRVRRRPVKSPTTPRTPSESGYCPALYRLGRVASPLAVGEAGAAGVGEGAARGHMVGGDGGRVSRKGYFFLSNPLPPTSSLVRITCGYCMKPSGSSFRFVLICP